MVVNAFLVGYFSATPLTATVCFLFLLSLHLAAQAKI